MVVPVTSRGRPLDASVEQRVLPATRELLAASSLADLRIDDIARRSGVAKTTIYRRWPSLTHLVVAAMADLVGEREVTITDDPEEDLQRIALAGLRSLRTAGPSLPPLALTVHRHGDAQLRREYRARLIDPLRGALIDCLQRGQARGVFRADADAPLAVDAMIGAAIYRLAILHETPTEADAKDLVSLLLDGVRPQPSREREQ